jgi:nitrous oxide reductase
MDVQHTAADAAAVKGKIAVIIRGNCPFVDNNSAGQWCYRCYNH